jgi:hypothetical protein
VDLSEATSGFSAANVIGEGGKGQQTALKHLHHERTTRWQKRGNVNRRQCYRKFRYSFLILDILLWFCKCLVYACRDNLSKTQEVSKWSYAFHGIVIFHCLAHLGFGKVYRGTLLDGTDVAVKRLDPLSLQVRHIECITHSEKDVYPRERMHKTTLLLRRVMSFLDTALSCVLSPHCTSPRVTVNSMLRWAC